MLLSYVPGTTKVQAVDELLHDRESILKEVRTNLIVAYNRMKVMADQNRCVYEVGDYVYLKLQPYRQTTVAFRGSPKLAPRFSGLYKV